MSYPQENDLRSIRVDGLPPTNDAIYLFSCFHDNAKVLAATVLRNWLTQVPLDYGFVEFASRRDAEFVLESYNGEGMPNLSHERRFCLSWDTDGSGTRWRWDYFYQGCSFFGYNDIGKDLDAYTVIKELQSACPNTCGDSGDTENQLDHAKSNGLSPDGYLETDVDKRLKLTDMPLTHPNMYQQGCSGPSLTNQQNPPDPMQWNGACGAAYVNQPPYQQLQTQWVGGCAAAYVNQPPYQQLQTQLIGDCGAAYVNQPPYQQLQTQWIGGCGTACVVLPPYQELEALWKGGCGAAFVIKPPHLQLQTELNIGSDAYTLGQLTQVRRGDLKVVSSMKKERELYLCFEEVIGEQSCYVFRTIKLSELLACRCKFSIKTSSIDKCKECARKTKPESQLRQRAWLFTGHEASPSCRGKEERFPMGTGCLAYGSQMFFAGGRVPSPDAVTTESCVPSTGDVYKFEAESTSWQKLDWSFQKAKPDPWLFEVNGNLYCLSIGGPLDHATFEVYDSSSRECLVLPEPQVYLPGLKDGSSLKNYLSFHKLACAVVGTKILISNRMGLMASPCIPIICFDVNDKEQKWRVMTSLFDGKPFPFKGRALVLDLNGTQVMFSFRGQSGIFVSRLAVNDYGDISISYDEYVGGADLVYTLMKDVSSLSYAFVDLGDQNVAFVLSGNIHTLGKISGIFLGKVRVVVVVMRYQVLGSKYITSEILATRTFEYNCRSPDVGNTDLTGVLVV